MPVEPPPIPTEDRKPAWRAAVPGLAREARGASDHAAHMAAVAAVQAVMPLPYEEASAEAVNAVAYATRHHAEWFRRGIGS